MTNATQAGNTKMKTQSQIDRMITSLQPGQAVEISRTTAGHCTVELSGDGQTVRFVRHIGDSSTVYKTCRK